MAIFISLEDHFLSQAALTQASDDNGSDFAFNLWPAELQSQLSSLSDSRISDMDSGQVALQVVSSIPTSPPLDICIQTNDQLASAIHGPPYDNSNGRLAAFATLPMSSPLEAASELSRCVESLGFLGALIPNHAADGRTYDTLAHRPFWCRAQDLDVPIYLHPCPPETSSSSRFSGDLIGPDVATMLSMGGWGWHADVALHFIKLYASGLFDACPRLKLVLGHMGEMLPAMITRIDGRITRLAGRERGLRQVWAENVWITVSGIWDLAPFACAIRSVALDRIMFSVDYPFERNETGRDFMTKVRGSGLVTEEEWEMIAFGNAEKLLRIKRPIIAIEKGGLEGRGQ